MNTKMIAGMKNTWNAKNRLSVWPPQVSPARTKWATAPPIAGIRPTCSATTATVHTAVWSHRSSWPVNAITIVTMNSTTPVSQFASRGYL